MGFDAVRLLISGLDSNSSVVRSDISLGMSLIIIRGWRSLALLVVNPRDIPFSESRAAGFSSSSFDGRTTIISHLELDRKFRTLKSFSDGDKDFSMARFISLTCEVLNLDTDESFWVRMSACVCFLVALFDPPTI